MDTIILETERLTLIPLSTEHIDSLYHIWSDPQVTKYMDIATFTDKEQAAKMVEFLSRLTVAGGGTRYSIVETASQAIIGTIGLNYIDEKNRRAEVGYELATSSWGKGYATELLNGYLFYEKKQKNLHRVEAFIVPENIPSIKLVEKLGFTHEATLKDYECNDGIFQDMYLYVKLLD